MKYDNDWTQTLAAFRVIAAQLSVKKVSPEIPASCHTVYRLIKGETRRPSRAVRAGVERVVLRHSKLRRL